MRFSKKKNGSEPAEKSEGRIYSYGASAPTEGLDLVMEQMRLAHVYRNKLVELERARRVRVNDTIQQLCPRLDQLTTIITAKEEEIETIRTAIKSRNTEKRKRGTSLPEERAQIKTIKAELSALREELKTVKAEAFKSEVWNQAQVVINAWQKTEEKRLRSECGLYWGTYLTVEQSMGNARKGAPPEFRRWTWDSKLAVQLQKGRSVGAIWSGVSNQLRVTSAGRESVAHFRVGSDESGKPIWCQVPFVLHRPIPSDCAIKWCYLLRRRIGTHDHWRLQFVLTRPSWDPGDRATSGRVGIDLGWRIVPTGLRVAYCVDYLGQEESLIIPRERLERWHKCESLQSIRDLLFNAMRTRLSAWKKDQNCPEWFQEATKFLHLWKSQGQLASLVLRWRENRFVGDGLPLSDNAEMLQTLSITNQEHYGRPVGIYEIAEAWRKKDKHLYNWQAHQRENNTAWRDDFYRVFAARMRRTYQTVKVEDCDWQKLMRQTEAEEDPRSEIIKLYQRIAAPGRLREILRETVSDLRECPTPNTTKIHFDCGNFSGQEDRSILIHTCKVCGLSFDQDRNAALNLLHYEPPAVAASEPALVA